MRWIKSVNGRNGNTITNGVYRPCISLCSLFPSRKEKGEPLYAVPSELLEPDMGCPRYWTHLWSSGLHVKGSIPGNKGSREANSNWCPAPGRLCGMRLNITQSIINNTGCHLLKRMAYWPDYLYQGFTSDLQNMLECILEPYDYICDCVFRMFRKERSGCSNIIFCQPARR